MNAKVENFGVRYYAGCQCNIRLRVGARVPVREAVLVLVMLVMDDVGSCISVQSRISAR